jgi:tetratricopeptide (TPR) repeat protein
VALSQLGALQRCTSEFLKILVFSWLLPTQFAYAEVDPPGYRAAIDEAVAEFSAGNYPEAQTLFRRAHAIYPNARTLRGLGVVAFEQRRYAESAKLLEAALAAEQRRLDGELRAETERVLARARGFVGYLELTVEPLDAEVFVDGEKATIRAGEPLSLDVGTHSLEFRASGYRSERRTHRVEGTSRARWTIRLQAEQQEGRSEGQGLQSAASNDVERSPQRSAALAVTKWSLLSAGIALSGVAGAAIAMREKRGREVEGCPLGLSCADSAASGKRWERVAISTGALAGTLLLTSIGIFWADRKPVSGLARSCTVSFELRGLACSRSF